MEKIQIFEKTFFVDAGGVLVYSENDIPDYMRSEQIRQSVIENIENSFAKRINIENKKNNVLEIYLKSSNKCNLKCDYCFRKENNLVFNEKYIKEFIEYIVREYKYEKIKVDLTGDSEPLLEIDKINKIISICNDIGEKTNTEFVYSLNSNGTYFNADIQDFLYKNSIVFGFTYEGITVKKYKRIFENGIPAVSDVEENIKKYELNKNSLFGISMTLTSEHSDLVEEYKTLLGLCNAVSMRIVNTFDDIGVNNRNIGKWKQKYSELAKYLLEQLQNKEYNRVIPILRSRDFFGTFIQTVLFKVKKNQSCLAGYKQFFLNYDGNVYICSWGCDCTKYKVGEKLRLDKHATERYKKMTVDNDDKCRKCSVKYICGGECYIIKGRNEKLDAWCELKRHLIALAFYIVDWLDNNDMYGKEILKSSISQNAYCDKMEDYLKVILDIFKRKRITKGPNYIKNEIKCIDNGPTYNDFIDYLRENNLIVSKYSESNRNEDTIYIIYEQKFGYNSYRQIFHDQVTKYDKKNIICID